MSNHSPSVLVVDDEKELADLYATWLREEYDVRTAYGGKAALEAIDETIDVVLLDRLMPKQPGDEVLGRIRREGYDCRVAMVTAVEPDFDIIELGFDDYLVKPIRREDVISVAESLYMRSTYSDQLQEFFALVSKRAALQSLKSPYELEDSEAYAELTDEIERLESELDHTTDELDTRDFEVEMRKIGAHGPA